MDVSTQLRRVQVHRTPAKPSAEALAVAPSARPAEQVPLPDPFTLAAEIEALRRRAELAERRAAQAERQARLAGELQSVILDAPPSWTPRDRLIAAAMVLTAEQTEGQYRPVPHSVESIGAAVGMSANTARKAIGRLHAADVADYSITRTPVNRYGEPLDESATMSEERGDRWETATILAVREIAGPLPELADVDAERADRERRQRERDELARLREAVQVIESATCPHCGEAHGLRVVCRDCGTFVTAEELPAPETQTLSETADATPTPETQTLSLDDGDTIVPADWTTTTTAPPEWATARSETQNLRHVIERRKLCVSGLSGVGWGTEGEAQDELAGGAK